ncbi:unnamed protein product [Lampetra planeri]
MSGGVVGGSPTARSLALFKEEIIRIEVGWLREKWGEREREKPQRGGGAKTGRERATFNNNKPHADIERGYRRVAKHNKNGAQVSSGPHASPGGRCRSWSSILRRSGSLLGGLSKQWGLSLTMELLAGVTIADHGGREVLMCGDQSDPVAQTFGDDVTDGEKDAGDMTMEVVEEEAGAIETEEAHGPVDGGDTTMLMSKEESQGNLQEATRAVVEIGKANHVPGNAGATQIILSQALGQTLGQTVSAGMMAQPGGQPFLIPISLAGQLGGSQQSLLFTLPSGGLGDAATAGGGAVGGTSGGGGAAPMWWQLLGAGGSGVQGALMGTGNAGGLAASALNLAGIQTLGMTTGGGGGLVVLPLQTLQGACVCFCCLDNSIQSVVQQAGTSPSYAVSIIPLMSLPPQTTPQPVPAPPAPCQLQTATPQIVTNAQGQVVGVLIGNQLMPIAGPGTQLIQPTSHFLPMDPGGQLYATTAAANSTPAPASNQVATPKYSVVGNQLITAGEQLLEGVSSPTQIALSPVKVAQKAGGCASVTSPLKIVTASPVGAAEKPAKAIRNVPILKRSKQVADVGSIAGRGGNIYLAAEAVDLEEIREFAKVFKLRRLALGLTQTQVGQALSAAEGPAYSQSAICRFEKLDLTPKSAQKMRPILERWMGEAEARHRMGTHTLTDFIGSEPSKRRKRRTSFTQEALAILNTHFDVGMHPTSAEMTQIAEQLGYDREVVRIWFCNKRQALKNTIKQIKHHQHIQQSFAASAQAVAVSAAAPATSVVTATTAAMDTSNVEQVLVMVQAEHDAGDATADTADTKAGAGRGTNETETLGDASAMEGPVDGGGAGEEVSAEALMRALGKVV